MAQFQFVIPQIDGGFVDAHAHSGRQRPGWRTPHFHDDLVAYGAELGIARFVMSELGVRDASIPSPTDEQLVAANRIAADAVTRRPQFAGLVYCSPEHIDLSLQLMERHIANGPFVGVKLWIARRASDRALDPILEYAAELDVPVLQHAWYKTRGGFPGESTPADVADLAARHPTVTIQMGHLTGCGERGVLDIEDLDNVYVDTCGGPPEAGLVEFALERLGPRRLLFGTDVPTRDLAVQLARVVALDLAAEDYTAIMGGNARRIYRRLGER